MVKKRAADKLSNEQILMLEPPKEWLERLQSTHLEGLVDGRTPPHIRRKCPKIGLFPGRIDE